jgi:AcrR family transcriptional regulator
MVTIGSVQNSFSGQQQLRCPASDKMRGLSMSDRDTPRPPIDRRAARTRAKLHDALLALLAEQDYEAIAVTDVCARADVSRSAFYAHYADKDDLMRDGLDHLRRLASAQASHGDASLAFGVNLLHHARDHLHFHKSLGDRALAIIDERIRAILSDRVRNELAAAARQTSRDVPRELVIQYLVGGYMAAVRWWLDGGARLPAVQVDAMLRKLATEGVAGRA